MGNWRTVNIIGEIPDDVVDEIREHYTLNRDTYENFNCLTITGGICGLDWVYSKVSAIGNLAERDYDIDDIKEQLEFIAEKWPEVELKVHVGDDYEDKTCIATLVLRDGEVRILEPEIEELMDIPPGQMKGNLLNALMGG